MRLPDDGGAREHGADPGTGRPWRRGQSGDGPAVHLAHPARDGEAEAGPSPAVVGACGAEAGKDVLLTARGDARPLVGDREGPLVAVVGGGVDGDGAAGR